jgi:hypothetical protein
MEMLEACLRPPLVISGSRNGLESSNYGRRFALFSYFHLYGAECYSSLHTCKKGQRMRTGSTGARSRNEFTCQEPEIKTAGD